MTITSERLRTRMAEIRITQQDLALEIGCSPGLINKIVCGQIQNSKVLPRIAARIGVPLAWLQGAGDDRREIARGELLGAEERELIENYRSSSKNGRAELLAMSRGFAARAALDSLGSVTRRRLTKRR